LVLAWLNDSSNVLKSVGKHFGNCSHYFIYMTQDSRDDFGHEDHLWMFLARRKAIHSIIPVPIFSQKSYSPL